MAVKPVISEELAAFLESGLAIVAATRDSELQPDGAVAWAARVHGDRTRLTVFFYDDAARELMPNLKSYPQIAINFDRPTTHRACQVKGVVVSSRKARPAEKALVEKQVNGFADDLEEIGIPRAMTTGWKMWPCTAFEVEVTELYEQTPGPGAGERMK